MTLTFEKDEDNRWYVVLPEWPGDRAELEMVAGADALCDILAHNGNLLHVKITSDLTPWTKVVLHRWKPKDDIDGAFYRADFEGKRFESFDIWLCPVTLFVFRGQYPNVIYIS